jgi:hypothetical protein
LPAILLDCLLFNGSVSLGIIVHESIPTEYGSVGTMMIGTY